jgi:hypothetical protein
MVEISIAESDALELGYGWRDFPLGPTLPGATAFP